jgi:hypothetical protein
MPAFIPRAMKRGRRDRARHPAQDRNEVARNLYILLSGAAKLSGFNKAQEPVVVSLMPPGETFGISVLLRDWSWPPPSWPKRGGRRIPPTGRISTGKR